MDREDIQEEFRQQTGQPTIILNKCDVGTNPKYIIWLENRILELSIQRVIGSCEHKERIEAYKECFETYIPTEKWDEATLFLSTYGNGLAKELAKKQ